MIPADFPWRPGMLYTTSTGARVRLTERGESVRHVGAVLVYRPGKPEGWPPPSDADPVLSDAATIGALAGAVREAWRDPYAHAVPLVEGSLVGPPRWRWRVLCAIPGPEPIRVRLRDFVDDDLGAAWLAAWTARPRSST